MKYKKQIISGIVGVMIITCAITIPIGCMDVTAERTVRTPEELGIVVGEDIPTVRHNTDVEGAIDEIRANIDAEYAESKESYDPKLNWEYGTASAYGGYGDDDIIDNRITATGDDITEESIGVALPIAYGNVEQYYGKKILIRYNDIIVEAVINDCGYMENGIRTLDLQPGVFRRFGYDNCNDWGVRLVEYVIVD